MTAIPTRAAAGIAGLASLIIVWWVWGAINPIPVVSDEQSYVLQSRIFATGHWTAPSPPISEFFEQSHVLTVPAVASKFPPGHALLMSLGTLIGSPTIMPLLLTALTGALLFLLARRAANVWVATLALIMWLGDPINLRFRPSYFSEITTQAMWLVSWWALLEWRQTRDRRWLLALAAAIGWGAITRPLTLLAFAIPVGVVVIRDVVRLKLWRDFGIAVALGIMLLGVIPLWSSQTTGDWTLTPLTQYQRDYLPYDKPGFGVDTTAPARPLNIVNRFTYSEFYREHASHTVANLPRIAVERLRVIAISEWSPRLILVPFVVVGLFSMSAEVAFALICSVGLFIAYLSYGHFSEWTLYYFEGVPVLSMLAALGLWSVIELVAARVRGAHGTILAARMAMAALVPVVALTIHEARTWRERHRQDARWNVEFNDMVSALPKNPTVIFVHYTPRLQPHPNIVRNSPHLDDETVWIVNDLGDRDHELMRVAGPRVPIAFYEDGRRFEVDRSLLKRR